MKDKSRGEIINLLKIEMLRLRWKIEKYTTFYQVKGNPTYYFTAAIPLTKEKVEQLREQAKSTKGVVLYRHNLCEDDIVDTLDDTSGLHFGDFEIGTVSKVGLFTVGEDETTFAIVTFEIKQRDLYYFKSTGSLDDRTYTEDTLEIDLVKGETAFAFRVRRTLDEYNSHPDVRKANFDELRHYCTDGDKEYYSYCLPKDFDIDLEKSTGAAVYYRGKQVGVLDFTTVKLVYGEGVCNHLILLCDLPYVDYNTPLPVFVNLVYREGNVVERIDLVPFTE